MSLKAVGLKAHLRSTIADIVIVCALHKCYPRDLWHGKDETSIKVAEHEEEWSRWR